MGDFRKNKKRIDIRKNYLTTNLSCKVDRIQTEIILKRIL